jgi:hypothetical protein
MNISLIAFSLITIVAGAVIIYLNGWRKGLGILSFVGSMLIIYILTIYFFGQEGKKYLSGILVVAAFTFLMLRKKKGKSIW